MNFKTQIYKQITEDINELKGTSNNKWSLDNVF